MITVTNMCFVEPIELGHGNRDRLGNQGCHAPMMEIVLVFKGWTSSKCRLELERHLE